MAHPAVQHGILIPPDTTLKFYTVEHNVRLGINNKNDYSTINKSWRQFRPDWVPLQPKHTTYNYRLSPETREGSRDQAMSLDWGGAEAVSPESGPRYLCEGTPKTCPTPELILAEKAGEVIPADRWKHHCTGLLGEFQGRNLHWMVCAEFESTPDSAVAGYLHRGGDKTYFMEKTGIDLLTYDEQTAVMRDLAVRWSALAEAGRGLGGDTRGAQSFMTELVDVLGVIAKYPGLPGPDAESGSELSKVTALDEDMAARVALTAKGGLLQPVDIANFSAEHLIIFREWAMVQKSYRKLVADQVTPFVKQLRETLAPRPSGT